MAKRARLSDVDFVAAWPAKSPGRPAATEAATAPLEARWAGPRGSGWPRWPSARGRARPTRRAEPAVARAPAAGSENPSLWAPRSEEAAQAMDPRGAHLLGQIRTKVLNDELTDAFRRRYSGFRPAAAAA